MADDDNTLIAQRRQKLEQWRAAGNAFPNHFRPDRQAVELQRDFADADKQLLESEPHTVRIAGRILSRRIMGKASFAGLRDGSGDIQLFVQQSALGESAYEAFKQLDIGDIVGVTGTVFRTRTGELSVRCTTIELLTKSLRPLPEKFHGLADQETRYRQRYVDLIVNQETRARFRLRSAVVTYLREYLVARGFIEVETPMMQPIPGGAAARPFITHHHALDIDLYLRIAPELYLKRLVVGGFERVFEINRNFRNEGLSTRHNPEFTMLEFYQAYADFEDLMNLTEDMLRGLATTVLGTTAIASSESGQQYDFGRPFRRLGLADAVLEFNSGIDGAMLASRESLCTLAGHHGIAVEASWGTGKLLTELFEATVEAKLIDPTFITHYPTEVSPLSRASRENPEVTDRFELYIGGREIANGFSELNDADEQAARFRQQVSERSAGDTEAMHYDADFVRALQYGMPPTAGEGIGIDRLVMLLTDSLSIRDVILFPHLRPEARSGAPPADAGN